MPVEYNGRKPGKFWYFRKNLGGIKQAFSDRLYKNRALTMRRDGMISAGAFGAGVAIVSIHAAAVIPFLVTIGPFVAGTAGLIFGIKSLREYKSLKRSPPVIKHVRDSEQKWLTKKQRAPFFKRLMAAIARPFRRKAKTAAATSSEAKTLPASTQAATRKSKKFLFIFNRKAKAVEQDNQSAAPAAAQDVPKQDASKQDAPVIKPAVSEPVLDPQREAAAKARAAARKRQRNSNNNRF